MDLGLAAIIGSTVRLDSKDLIVSSVRSDTSIGTVDRLFRFDKLNLFKDV